MALAKIETPEDFVALRRALGSPTQAEMAELMGVSPRTVFTIENNADAIQPYHIRLAEMLALELAVQRKDRSLVPKRVARLADAFAALT